MLTNDKVILKGLSENDLENILKLRQDFVRNRLYQREPFPVNEISEKGWLDNIYTKGLQKRIFLGIYDLQQNFIGLINAHKIDYIHKRCEFGIIINSENTGKGYALSATTLFLKYIFEEINIERVYLEVLEENTPAIKLYEKIGFVKEGFFRMHSYQEGKRKNVVYMAILRDEYIK